MSEQNAEHVVVGIGEVLFDRFPDRKVLGGAPVNFAYHAHQLLTFARCGRGVVVSRVGNDASAALLLEELGQRGLATGWITTDGSLPSGEVLVQTDADGQPTYDIREPVAWDGLSYDQAVRDLASTCSAVCFGSLAQRHEASRDTIRQFVHDAGRAVRVFDVNLRQSYYSAEVIEWSLTAATIVKLNHEELTIVGDLLDIGSGAEDDILRARRLCDRFKLRFVALTYGARGTVLVTTNEKIEGDPVSTAADPDADAVGAGDACTAGLVCGVLWQLPLVQVVRLANALGAFVASRAGATPTLPTELLQTIVPASRPSPSS